MSRTYRNKYVPARDKSSIEQIEETKAFSQYYAQHGESPDGLRWYTTNWKHKSGCAYIRFDKNVNRDGNKAHGDISVMLEIAKKRIDSKVREKMRQELRRMKAGVIGWDENIENANKIRAYERSLCWYDIT
ncbi:hypothetical protein Lw1_gp138 [Escherichia phage Lw1]|uniref:Uncharacterized protein n=1 Tax=Escherichia phage Lw1 TaxID=1307804 RepID=M9UXT3_9CAUD|nr:hypothetical protein Lw1_gp138 [Escherichia phage Lw1]AGJ71546.1 hypothetical protein Lw1_gp138 [Escherichia phage Lw1]